MIYYKRSLNYRKNLLKFVCKLSVLILGAPAYICYCFYVQFSSVAQCLILCDPMDCSTTGFPAHHQLLEFTQTYVH